MILYPNFRSRSEPPKDLPPPSPQERQPKPPAKMPFAKLLTPLLAFAAAPAHGKVSGGTADSLAFGDFISAQNTQAGKQEELAKCPGEGPRYGDYKCNNDSTHRVCLKLVEKENGQCKPRPFLPAGEHGNTSGRDLDFWDVTGQKQFEWSNSICTNDANAGEGWCICKWAFARMVEKVGCENLHIYCTATDVEDVLRSYHDGGVRLAGEPHACMKEKCKAQGLL